MTGHANQTIHRVPHQEIRCQQKLPMTVNSSDPKTCCSLEKEELSKTQHTPNKQSNNVKSSHVMSNLVKSLSNLLNSFYHEQTARETRSNLRRNNVRSLSHTSALAGKENKKFLVKAKTTRRGGGGVTFSQLTQFELRIITYIFII